MPTYEQIAREARIAGGPDCLDRIRRHLPRGRTRDAFFQPPGPETIAAAYSELPHEDRCPGSPCSCLVATVGIILDRVGVDRPKRPALPATFR